MRVVHAVLAALAVTGCASFLHFEDKQLQSVSCAITAAVLPELEAMAVAFGFPLEVIEAMYADACSVAASSGMSQKDAEAAGLTGAKFGAQRLKAFGAHFSADAGAP